MSVKTKQAVATRVVGPACGDGCFDKFISDQKEAVVYGFWTLNNFDKQNANLGNLVRNVGVSEAVLVLVRIGASAVSRT